MSVASNRPLEGLVVVEVCATVPPAFACVMLADYGANVFVVEPHPEGSPVRTRTPSPIRSAWWSSIARGKRSLGDQPSDPESLCTARALVACADAVVTDLTEHARESHPLFAGLALSPHGAVLDIFPSGSDSPDATVGDRMTAARTGMSALTGWPSGPPVVAEVPLAESLAGMMGAVSLMAELTGRRRRGRDPRALSMASHEAVQRMIEWQLPVAALRGRSETRIGNGFPLNAGISNMHRTADGKYVAISAANQTVAMRLLAMIGGKRLTDDPRFATPAARADNMPAIHAEIDLWIGARDRDEILKRAADADVVVGPVHDVDDLINDPHLQARRNLFPPDESDPQARYVVATVPGVFGGRDRPAEAPAVGQHRADAREIVRAAQAPRSTEHER